MLKIGLTLEKYRCKSLHHFGSFRVFAVDYLLFLVRDVRLQPNPEEVADVMYVNKEQLRELLRKADAGEGGITLSPWFRLVVDNFLFDWWEKLDDGTLGSAVDMDHIHRLYWCCFGKKKCCHENLFSDWGIKIFIGFNLNTHLSSIGWSLAKLRAWDYPYNIALL